MELINMRQGDYGLSDMIRKPDMTFSDTSWAVDMRGKYL